MIEVKEKKPCSACALYRTGACVGKKKRKMLLEDYNHDCFTSEEDKAWCDMLCPEPEEDYE